MLSYLRSEPKKAKNPSIKRPHEQVEYVDTAETKRPKHDEEEDEADLLADLE